MLMNTTGSLHILPKSSATALLKAPSDPCAADDGDGFTQPFHGETSPRRVRDMITAAIEGSRQRKPVPPREWASALRRLAEVTRGPAPATPVWWKPTTTFCGGLETRLGSNCDAFDEAIRGQSKRSAVCLQLTLAGWGQFTGEGAEPQKVSPGTLIFLRTPSQHRFHLPKESPGWTFAWVAIRHPYLKARLAKRAAVTGPLLDLAPDGVLGGSFVRLVRGAIEKDFRDQLEVEMALVEFALTFERWTQRTLDSVPQDQRLIDEVRTHIEAKLPEAIEVRALAAEFGMSRSHFSHFFRKRTGMTPAHFAAEIRVQKATNMLIETGVPLKAIAGACGFANANHFCKVFRRLRQLSPATFRQLCR
jgi:AraC-like DNA-binding protein